MSSWGLSLLIEMRSANPEDTKGPWYFYLLGLQHAMIAISPHVMTLHILRVN